MDPTILTCLGLALLCVGVGMSFQVADKSLTKTKALPNGGASTVTDAIDLGHGTTGRLLANMEFLLEAPAMGVTPMSNGKTMIYSVETDNDAAFGSAKVVISALLTQTGAGGAGCAAASERFRLPTNCERYIRVKATGSTTGDASASSMTLTPVF